MTERALGLLASRGEGVPSKGDLSPLLTCAWLVAADDPAAAASACQEVVRRLRSPRAFLVRLGMAFKLPRLDQRIDDLPRELDLLSARERRVPAGDDFAEHVLVRVGQGYARQPRVVEPHARRHHLEPNARTLGADAQ